ESRRAGLHAEFSVITAGTDLDANDDGFDPEAFVARQAARSAHGVVATKDRSALLAALIAERCGLSGPTPGAMLACQHKPTSRRLQQQAAPEAIPRFALLSDGVVP